MDPFPPIERWQLPRTACSATLDAVSAAGRRCNESGVFWLGPRAALSEVSAVIIPTGAGVIETARCWRISPEVYASVAAWAKPRGLSLLAVVHTHVGSVPPRLSHTDRTQGVKAPDTLAVIIGRAGEEQQLAAWGWYVYEREDYRALVASERRDRVELVDRDIEVVRIEAQAAGAQHG
jgi:proteasome lid subunit RPN8/RPN11